MDHVEIARQFAADLHNRARAQGSDPAHLYEFALAVASGLDLAVEGAAPGAAVLDGGRATFIPDSGLIVHENGGSAFDQAFLVAHEIGHAALGDARGDEVQFSIDPTRAMEPSPSGFERVVDYGRRQRREIQMDLFARELLLPRDTVRQMHLNEGLTASAIAQKIGAPFEFVAQQLLDALLLPAIRPEVIDLPDRELNPLQQAAATYSGRAYILEAGPGTGKTQTLAGRISHLLLQGVDPRRILVLTFSNKAANEMAERIAHKHKEAAAAMWLGTFHAFGLDLIRRFHFELGLPKDPRLLDRTEAVELLEEGFPRLPLKHYRDTYDPSRNIVDILGAISRAKDEVVGPAAYAKLAKSMLAKAQTDDERKAAEKVLEVAAVYEAYEKRKRAVDCVDFGDLVFLPVTLLEEHPDVKGHLQGKYDHILVDEYQDVNRSSIRLLSALSKSADVWAVGDAKQSIYRFRGASSFNMERFGKEDFPNAERGQLRQNYRSVPEIASALSAFSCSMIAGGEGSGLEPERAQANHSPELRIVDRGDEQAVAIAEAIEEMRRAGYAYRDQAVLCSGNERLSILGRNLERLGIPVLFLGSLFERPEVKDVLALVSILVDDRAMGLLRVATLADFAMSVSDASAVIDHLRSCNNTGIGWLKRADEIPQVSHSGQAALRRIAVVLDGFNETSRPWEVLVTVLLDRTRMAAEIGASTNAVDRARGIALWQLLNFLRVQPAAQGGPIRRLLDRIRRLMRLNDDRDLRQLPLAAQGLDAVRLMTIHGAKGLEFPVVHFPGINNGTIPRTPSTPPCPPPDGMVEGGDGSSLEVFRAAHSVEQECLFYVAISRARDRLLMYAQAKNSNGANRPLSPFLEKLEPYLRRRRLEPATKLPIAPEDAPIQLSFQGAVRFTAEQLALYEKCPRRFFYTHLMKVGGARTQTPFTNTHEAVRGIVRGIIDEMGDVYSAEEIDQRIIDAFQACGLADHGYADDYRALAAAMVKYLFTIRDGLVAEKPAPLVLKLGPEEIVVSPDDVLKERGGRRRFRKVQTGHQRSSALKDVAAAAFVLAVQRADLGAEAEIVYLSDEVIHPLSLSSRELQGRSDKLTAFLKRIRAGEFPASPDVWTCPGCPAFFICGPVPGGTLERKL